MSHDRLRPPKPPHPAFRRAANGLALFEAAPPLALAEFLDDLDHCNPNMTFRQFITTLALADVITCAICDRLESKRVLQ
jgi:hypothetical protein